jgi:hypothetical protein
VIEFLITRYVDTCSVLAAAGGKSNDDWVIAKRFMHAEKMYTNGNLGVSNDVIYQRILNRDAADALIKSDTKLDEMAGPIGELYQEFIIG